MLSSASTEAGVKDCKNGDAGADKSAESHWCWLARIRELRRASEGTEEFLWRFWSTVIDSYGCILLLIVLVAVPVGAVVIGVMYYDQCEAEPYIPKYLVAQGFASLIHLMATIVVQILAKARKDEEDFKDRLSKTYRLANGLYYTFGFLWFMAGNYWIYHTWDWGCYFPNGVNDIATCDNGTCNSLLLLFAFWLTNAVYATVGALGCCSCWLACLAQRLAEPLLKLPPSRGDDLPVRITTTTRAARQLARVDIERFTIAANC